MSYIYRVLGPNEEMHYEVDKKLYSNSEYDGIFHVYDIERLSLSDNLDELLSHIQCGNNTTSKWISCSKNLITDLEKYTVSKISWPKIHRSDVAIIRNHDTSTLKIKGNDFDFFEAFKKIPKEQLQSEEIKNAIRHLRSLKNNDIEKLVIDLQDERLLYYLFELGFIKTKSGKKPSLGSRALNYANASDEILVFNQIDNKYSKNNYIYNMWNNKVNIPFILSPIVYDVIYALITNGSIPKNSKDGAIIDVLSYMKIFSPSILTIEQRGVYNNHYLYNFTLEYIIESYDDLRLDTLSLYNELIKIKKSIIRTIIININKATGKNYNYENINLIDETSYILRSTGNYQNIYAQLLDGTKIWVPALDDEKNIFYDNNISNNISSIVSCQDNPKYYYTIRNGQIYKFPRYSIEKTLERVRKIG